MDQEAINKGWAALAKLNASALRECNVTQPQQHNSESKKATIYYLNWKGERAYRTIIPEKIWFGKTEFHPEKQWFLDAFDVEKQAMRSFAMTDIESWT